MVYWTPETPETPCWKKTLWQKWVKSNMFKHLFLFPFIGHFFTEFANSFCCSPPGKSKSGENSLLTKQKWAQSLYSTSNSKKRSRFDPAKPPPNYLSNFFFTSFQKTKRQPNQPNQRLQWIHPSIKQANRQPKQPSNWSARLPKAREAFIRTAGPLGGTGHGSRSAEWRETLVTRMKLANHHLGRLAPTCPQPYFSSMLKLVIV